MHTLNHEETPPLSVAFVNNAMLLSGDDRGTLRVGSPVAVDLTPTHDHIHSRAQTLPVPMYLQASRSVHVDLARAYVSASLTISARGASTPINEAMPWTHVYSGLEHRKRSLLAQRQRCARVSNQSDRSHDTWP